MTASAGPVPPILEMRSITKEFPGVKALSGVSFAVNRGEIHALCGENGAGKSTLMKILSGFHPYPSYSGEVFVEGRAQQARSTGDSERAGIAVIYQELSLVREMTIGENIFIGHEPRTLGVIRWNEVYARSRKLLEAVGLDVNPREQVKYLGIGQQQLVEIAKALSHDPRILILDEPTSALTKAEIRNLLAVMKRLRAEGVSCVMISHKLDEVFEVADRITVLRDGRSVATYEASAVDEHRIISDMVGRELKDLYPRGEARHGATVFEVRDWTVTHPSIPGRNVLEKISFSVRAGEILGISGLMGAGRTELLMSIFGSYAGRKTSGELLLGGKTLRVRTPHDAIAAGLALVSEDRKRYGLVLEDTVARNTSLAGLSRVSHFGIIDQGAEFAAAEKYRKLLRVKTPSLQAMVKNLSGGNQQKVVLSKCLMTEPRVLFLDEPTRGIDVGARAEIYQLMSELAASGLAIVMVSSELPEVLGMSDRILVMGEGRIKAELAAGEATQEILMTAAASSAGPVH